MTCASTTRNALPSFAPIVLAISLLITAGVAFGEVRLPSIISDHMVLKKAGGVPIWGHATPGESVTVTLGDLSAKTSADAGGRWRVTLDLSSSKAGPFALRIEGENRLAINDVVVGEVWLASGQSNMEFPLMFARDAQSEIAGSTNPSLRQFRVARNGTDIPAEDCKGEWVSASPETSGEFSAVAYFFAKKLQKELGVPVGIINSSFGGTPIEAWISTGAIDSVPGLKATRERLWAAVKDNPKNRRDFVDRMGAWIKENGREDKPIADVAAYTGQDVSADGWIPVKLPGTLDAQGLPTAGAIWLRKEIDIPKTGDNLPLSLPIDGYDSVYWNGRLLNQTTPENFPGTGSIRYLGPYDIPPDDVKRGKNILAIRLYEPVRPAKISGEPKAGPISLAGGWLAKTEYEFRPLDAKKIAAAPQSPTKPPEPQSVPAYLFNGMIQPLLPYAISGVIWYQGEFNVRRAYQYRSTFPLLITDWRKQWGRDDLPFYFCQLASFLAKTPQPGESLWAELREAQSMTLKLPDTGQAVLIDIGEAGDIHPKNKQDAGDRLAAIALANHYGKSVPFSGPVYQSMKVEGGRILLAFSHVDGGLVARSLPATYDVKTKIGETSPLVRNSPGSELEGFAICGADHMWVWADAKIDGDSVIVWSDKIPQPVAVRYAWADNPICNLYNAAGLPASPFRTDDESGLTRNATY